MAVIYSQQFTQTQKCYWTVGGSQREAAATLGGHELRTLLNYMVM